MILKNLGVIQTQNELFQWWRQEDITGNKNSYVVIIAIPLDWYFSYHRLRESSLLSRIFFLFFLLHPGGEYCYQVNEPNSYTLWGSVVPILDYSLEYSETVKKKKYQFSGPILSLIQIFTSGGLDTVCFFFFWFLFVFFLMLPSDSRFKEQDWEPLCI